MTITIRPALDGASVQAARALVAESFPEEPVELMADLLRAAPDHHPDLDLVAVEADGGGEIVGSAMLAPVLLRLADGGSRDALTLCLVAVRADRRGEGIARTLIEHALGLADRCGAPFVVLEGDPALYRRFGFVAAEPHGLTRPSPTIPPDGFQVRFLPADEPRLRGRVEYPPPFWAACCPGPPHQLVSGGPYTDGWLGEFARLCGWLEAVTAGADGEAAVPSVPGWTVTDLLTHVGMIHRVVVSMVRHGREPADPTAVTVPAGVSTHDWYAEGWRALYEVLAEVPPETPVATWSPADRTAGFWRRRMVHEMAIHSLDAFAALDAESGWAVPDAVALDGIDEILRGYLVGRLAERAGGAGGTIGVQVDAGGAGERRWEIRLGRRVEVSETASLTGADALVTGDPAAVYAWLWNRRAGARAGTVEVDGDPDVLADLRRCVALAVE